MAVLSACTGHGKVRKCYNWLTILWERPHVSTSSRPSCTDTIRSLLCWICSSHVFMYMNVQYVYILQAESIVSGIVSGIVSSIVSIVRLRFPLQSRTSSMQRRCFGLKHKATTHVAYIQIYPRRVNRATV